MVPAATSVKKSLRVMSALSDLSSEGWIIDGPHGKQPTMKHDADRHIYGYALRF